MTIVEKKSRKKLNTLLENNICLAVRQKQEHILISSPISTHRHSEKQNRISAAEYNKYRVEIGLEIIVLCTAKIILF